MSTKHPFCPPSTCTQFEPIFLAEAEAVDYDRRLMGFYITSETPVVQSAFEPVFYVSCFGTTVPVALLSTARKHTGSKAWEVYIGRPSGVIPSPMASGGFRVGEYGLDVPAGLTFALWLGHTAAFPPVAVDWLWTYASHK